MSDAASGSGPSPLRRKLIVAVPIVLFGALAALLYARLFSGDPSTLPSALIGRPVPDLTLPALDGLNGDGGAILTARP